MEFKFNEKLKELRNKKGVTQEQLASHLMISSQAVSKWERGEGYPDITLLPRIALYFGVSIDDLLGVNEVYINEQIEEWEKKDYDLRYRGEVMQLFALWDEAYRQYPNHPTVKYSYMQANWSVFMLDTTKNRDKAEKTIELGKEILERSTNTAERNAAIQLLAFTYRNLGDPDQAQKYAEMASDLWTCREVLLMHVLTGNEGLEHRQNMMMNFIDLLAQDAWNLGNRDRYCKEEKIKILHYVLELYRTLFTDGDYGFYSTRMSQYSSALAQLYAQVGDREHCLQYLQDALDFAMAYDRTDDHGQKRTSLLVNATTIDRTASSKNYTENECGLRLRSLQNQCYDSMREDIQFIRIKQELEKYAQ